MMRKELTEISKLYEKIGFNQRTEKPRLKGILYAMAAAFLLANEIAYVAYKWDDVEKRMNGLKGLFLYVLCSAYVVSTLFMWKRTKRIVKIIEDGRYKFPFQPTIRRKDIEHQIQEDAIKLNTAWYYILIGFVGSGIVTAVTVFLVKAVHNDVNTITAEMLYLPNPFYYPENYDNLLWYFLSFVTQFFYWIHLTRNAHLITVGAIICMQLMEGDLRLLRLSLEEMDSIIGSGSDNDFLLHSQHIRYQKMKMFVTHIVRHHCDIYRKIEKATKGMKLIAFSLSSVMSLMICTALYNLVKGQVLMVKIQEGTYCLSIVYCLYCLDLMGQKISNEDEILRETLYYLSWIDKPKWFKKSLQIIMTRANRTIEIKSVGMFTLNLRSFATALQTAYSFYNVLINFNN